MRVIEREESSEILEQVKSILPPNKYTAIEPLDNQEGAQRHVFRAKRGRGGVPVIIKTDRRELGHQAKMLSDRGYTTAHEIEVLQGIPVDRSIQNHVSPLLDFYEQGHMKVSVEPEFEESVSLKRFLNDGNKPTKQEFQKIFQDVVKGARFLIKEQELFHRDLNSSNILLRGRGESIESRLTDLATAIDVNSIQPKVDPTFGARSFVDPALQSKYTAQADMYAIGMNALMSLTGGQAPVYYDITKKIGSNLYTNETLFDQDGGLILERHEKAVAAALSKIPSEFSRHKEWIGKCLTLSEDKRYNSIDDLAATINHASRKTIGEYFQEKKKKIIPLMVAGAIALGGAGIGTYQTIKSEKEKHQLELKEKEKYQVSANWNGVGLELKNNLLELSVRPSYPGAYENGGQVKIKQGEKLSIYPNAREVPRTKDKEFNSPISVRGRAYIEGFATDGRLFEEFSVHSSTADETDSYGSQFAYRLYTYPEFTIPRDLPDGNYILAVELFPPTEGPAVNDVYKSLAIKNPGKAISRKRIPITVGNPVQKVDLKYLQLAFTRQSVGFRDLENESPYGSLVPHINSEFTIFENNKPLTRTNEYNFLEDIDKQTEKVLHVRAKSTNGLPILYSAVPVEREYAWDKVENKPEPPYKWVLGSVDESFPQRSFNERIKLEKLAGTYNPTNSYNIITNK